MAKMKGNMGRPATTLPSRPAEKWGHRGQGGASKTDVLSAFLRPGPTGPPGPISGDDPLRKSTNRESEIAEGQTPRACVHVSNGTNGTNGTNPIKPLLKGHLSGPSEAECPGPASPKVGPPSEEDVFGAEWPSEMASDLRDALGMPVLDLLPDRRAGLPGLEILFVLAGVRIAVVTTRTLEAGARARGVRTLSPVEAVTAAFALLGGPLAVSQRVGAELAKRKQHGEAWPRRQVPEGPFGVEWWPGVAGECASQLMTNGPTVGFLFGRLGARLESVHVEGDEMAVAS